MATLKHKLQHLDWATLIPSLAPFGAYILIMALVVLFSEGR
jgi:hypothetical protein